MSHTSISTSDRGDYFRFLDLPAELRNRIYDFTAETDAYEPRCVLPCLALAQTCQQLCTEYRSICMRRDIIIDWKSVAGYMRTFFPTVNGKIANVELVPTSMTIVTPWRGGMRGDGCMLDFLPMVKIKISRPDFTCHLIHDTAIPRPFGAEEGGIHDFERYLEEDCKFLRKLLHNQTTQWLFDIRTDAITKIMVSDLDVEEDEPLAVFYVKTSTFYPEETEDGFHDELERTYFERIGIKSIDINNGVWTEWKDFSTFPGLISEA